MGYFVTLPVLLGNVNFPTSLAPLLFQNFVYVILYKGLLNVRKRHPPKITKS